MLWIAKALAQSALALLPNGEELNYKFQQRGSHRETTSFLNRVRTGIGFIESIRDQVDVRNKRVMEIGTGWDGLHTVLLALLGAKEVITFDHVAHLRFADIRRVVGTLRAFSARLAAVYGEPEATIQARLSAWEREQDLSGLLTAMNVLYRAPADAGRCGLETASVDIVYSFLVLSFVRKRDLITMGTETRRVLRVGGLSIHHIRMSDPYDSLNGGDELKFLKVPEPVWNVLCNNSIQCNNRLRSSAYLTIFAGPATQVLWSQRELKAENVARALRMRPAKPFRGLAPEDLATTALSVVVRHNPESQEAAGQEAG